MVWDTYDERTVNLANPKDVAVIRSFLKKFDLSFDETVEYTMALYEKGTIVATGSFMGEVLRNIAVDETLQGTGLTAAVLSHLIREAGHRGIYHYFIYTRPDKAHLFSALGFTELARAEPYAALLESGVGSIREYCDRLKEQTRNLPKIRRAGIVVNCNPFTLGHQALIKRAAEENEGVIVFVVSEERSLFPFEDRIRLVREGLAELKNVVVVPGGKYIISAATFPSYFTRGEEVILAQTRLDASLFASQIAPPLGIKVRYVGEEPYCPVTSAYNRALLDILPEKGIMVRTVSRTAVDGEIVSASKVRNLIRQENWEQIRAMVPKTTYDYLFSEKAAPVIERIKKSQSRH